MVTMMAVMALIMWTLHMLYQKVPWKDVLGFGKGQEGHFEL
jgi:hypothetical protein